jgi:hypothetical protein
MSWLLLGILIYIFVGAVLVMRSMRGLDVSASPREWLTFIIMWPFVLKIFAHLVMTQAMIKATETLKDKLDEKS